MTIDSSEDVGFDGEVILLDIKTIGYPGIH
jgi:hypothetical protein